MGKKIQDCNNGCGQKITVVEHQGKWKPFAVDEDGNYQQYDDNDMPIPHDCPNSDYNRKKKQEQSKQKQQSAASKELPSGQQQILTTVFEQQQHVIIQLLGTLTKHFENYTDLFLKKFESLEQITAIAVSKKPNSTTKSAKQIYDELEEERNKKLGNNKEQDNRTPAQRADDNMREEQLKKQKNIDLDKRIPNPKDEQVIDEHNDEDNQVYESEEEVY